jgi:cytochrome c biogenesis protein CcmG/thiol:disulfide interchange protein DsbE
VSKRNTYLIGAAAVAVGIVLIVIAATGLSGDDEASTPGTTNGTADRPPAGPSPQSPPADEDRAASGEQAEGAGLARQLARGRRVLAPDFSLQIIQDGGPVPPQARRALDRASDGGELDLGRLRGTPVVLHMWSSECAPCRSEARLVEATWRRWGRRGVAFVGLSVKEPEDAVRAFAREYNLSHPIVRDPDGRTARAYGATGLPETFFISAGGFLVGHVAGSPSVRQMELGAAGARAGRPFGSEQGGSRVPLG